MNTYETILNITRRVLNNDEIQFLVSDSLLKLGLNSITFIKLVIEIEKEFDIEFDDDALDFEKYNSVDEFCNYVDKLVAKD